MINEKGLVAAMKDAWKETHYDVVAYEKGGGERLAVNTAFWVVDIPRLHFPRKALALIVEHAGEIPDNTAMSLSKARGQQTLVQPVALQAVETIYSLMKDKPAMDIEKTKLTWDNLEVWQKLDDLEVMLFDGFYLNIIDQKADDCFAQVYGQTMVFSGDHQIAAVMPVASQNDKMFLEHLSGMQWTGGNK